MSKSNSIEGSTKPQAQTEQKPTDTRKSTAKPRPTPTHSTFRRFLHRAKVYAGKSVRFTGGAVVLVGALNLGLMSYESSQVDKFFAVETDDKSTSNKKKLVLVLPFDNLQVIEHKSQSVDFNRFANRNKQPTIKIECKELVNVIEKAAHDPNITSLYADFGEGMRYRLGYAHIEEIRDAIQTFHASHKVQESSPAHNPVFALAGTGNAQRKQSYAFGHLFQWNDYFMASAFMNVHLQARGSLGLFGATTSNIFLKPFLDKYGIRVHVFRHGLYKNAPSFFTDSKYSKTHLENIKSTTSSIDDTIKAAIIESRKLKFDNIMWKSIASYGNITAPNSKEIGLIDAAPVVSPLSSLLEMNKKEAFTRINLAKLKEKLKNSKPPDDEDDEDSDNSNKEETKSMIRLKMEEKFGQDETFGAFLATEAVSLNQYKSMLSRKERIENRSKNVNQWLQMLAERSTATATILSFLGFNVDSQSHRKETVAVLTIDGQIGLNASYEAIRALTEIRKDKSVKCLVLRVNSPGGSVISSEAILEELKLFEKPIVCSMGNTAASGGYYISMNSEKIFALPTTLTGSIGVFGIKIDATELANNYGVRSDYYPHGSHAATMSPLTPLTKGMKQNFTRSIQEFYDYFKTIVSTGRSLSLTEVEHVAQGKVWTGEQAKSVGLVDELGGLTSALEYAKKTYTKSEGADVEYWPRKTFRFSDFTELLSSREMTLQDIYLSFVALILDSESTHSSESLVSKVLHEVGDLHGLDVNKFHIMMTMDDSTALNLILRGE